MNIFKKLFSKKQTPPVSEQLDYKRFNTYINRFLTTDVKVIDYGESIKLPELLINETESILFNSGNKIKKVYAFTDSKSEMYLLTFERTILGTICIETYILQFIPRSKYSLTRTGVRNIAESNFELKNEQPYTICNIFQKPNSFANEVRDGFIRLQKHLQESMI